MQQKTYHQIVLGDSRKMTKVDDAGIHLIVTSPPYWQLKDYGDVRQIGYHDSYEDYINNLNLVWQECYRVLHPGCRLCINIGDQYARAAHYGRYKVIPIRTEITKFCETRGFDYMGAIIWQKATTMNTTGGGSVMGSFPYPRNGILKLDYEFILIFKKQGRPPTPNPAMKKESALTNEEWNRYFRGHWNFPGVRQDKHLAMFPIELPWRLIKMFSFVGDRVLDPFAGSGTTSKAAQLLGRNSTAYEINSDFVPLIKDKLASSEIGSVPSENLFLRDEGGLSDKESALKQLPYLFKDPHKLSPNSNFTNTSFGSRVRQQGTGSEIEYFSVKKVLSPTSVSLNDGRVITLLGVAEEELKRQPAIQFLMNKTKGTKVFLKFDSAIGTDREEHLCYLFLKNKTFINAKLVQNGLVRVDTHTDFKFKQRFINLAKNGN